ncbi:MAG: hypothetical protein IH961_04630 [Chloroflexi bacterium]|nr:hypothetical protein [Chloroflexota bacterium]
MQINQPRQRKPAARRWCLLAFVVAPAILIAACGGSDDEATFTPVVLTPTAEPTAPPASTAPPARGTSENFDPTVILPGVGADSTSVWILNVNEDKVDLLSATGFVGSIHAGRQPSAIVFEGENVWIASAADAIVSILVPNENPRGPFRVGLQPRALEFDGQNIWVASAGEQTISKLSTDGEELATTFIGGFPTALQFDGEHIWVADIINDRLLKFNLDAERVGAVNTGRSPRALAFDGTNIWVSNVLDGTVSKISVDGNVVATYPVGGRPVDILYAEYEGGRYIWVANMDDDTVMKLSLDGQRVAVVPVDEGPVSLALFGSDLIVVSSVIQSLNRVPLATRDGG